MRSRAGAGFRHSESHVVLLYSQAPAGLLIGWRQSPTNEKETNVSYSLGLSVHARKHTVNTKRAHSESAMVIGLTYWFYCKMGEQSCRRALVQLELAGTPKIVWMNWR
jgi:hypothetical protein